MMIPFGLLTYFQDAQIAIKGQRILHILVNVILAACLFWFYTVQLRPFLAHTVVETERVARLLSQVTLLRDSHGVSCQVA
jgi:hypothetical protein